MIPVRLPVECLISVTIRELVEEFFRKSSERVGVSVVQPFHVVLLACFTRNSSPPKLILGVPLPPDSLRHLLFVEDNDIAGNQNASIKGDRENPHMTTGLLLFLSSLGHVLLHFGHMNRPLSQLLTHSYSQSKS